jgi:hypothetical protein
VIKNEPVEADLQKLKEAWTEYVDGKTGVALPADCPAYIRFWRLMGNVNEARGLTGFLIEVDFLFDGIKIYMKRSRTGKLQVMSESPSDGKELLAEWSWGNGE